MRYALIVVLLLAGCDRWTTDAALIVSNRAGGVTVVRFPSSGDCINAFVAMSAPIGNRVDAWCVSNVNR